MPPTIGLVMGVHPKTNNAMRAVLPPARLGPSRSTEKPTPGQLSTFKLAADSQEEVSRCWTKPLIRQDFSVESGLFFPLTQLAVRRDHLGVPLTQLSKFRRCAQ